MIQQSICFNPASIFQPRTEFGNWNLDIEKKKLQCAIRKESNLSAMNDAIFFSFSFLSFLSFRVVLTTFVRRGHGAEEYVPRSKNVGLLIML